MKNICLILFIFLTQNLPSKSVNAQNLAQQQNFTVVDDVVVKLNTLETSLNKLNENLIKLDSLKK